MPNLTINLRGGRIYMPRETERLISTAEISRVMERPRFAAGNAGVPPGRILAFP